MGTFFDFAISLCCSVTQSCPTLCDPINCSITGFYVLHCLLKFAHTHTFSQWCHATISSSVILFPSGPQSFPTSGSFPVSQLFVNPWTAARQAPLFSTISWSLLKLMSTESVMPCNHLILCHPLLFLPSIFPSIRIFSNESALQTMWPKYWGFSFSISPYNVDFL